MNPFKISDLWVFVPIGFSLFFAYMGQEQASWQAAQKPPAASNAPGLFLIPSVCLTISTLPVIFLQLRVRTLEARVRLLESRSETPPP